VVVACRAHDMTNSYEVLDGKPKEEIPLGVPRRRWKDNN
jgi:hypothetical protein